MAKVNDREEGGNSGSREPYISNDQSSLNQ